MHPSADEGDFGGRDGQESIAARRFIKNRALSDRTTPHFTETTPSAVHACNVFYTIVPGCPGRAWIGLSAAPLEV